MTSPPSRDSRLGELVAAGVHADVYEWRGGVGSSPLVVKLHRGEGAATRALAEAAALSVLQHRHIVRLVDVVLVAGADALGLVLPRLGGRSAAVLVAERGTLDAGEAVTLLVPVLLALQHLERSTLGHHVDLVSGVVLGDVLLDQHGAPVVVGVRAAAERGVERLARHPGGASGAAARAIDAVLRACPDGDPEARQRLAELCRRRSPIDELLEVLFDLAAPAPLDEEAPFEASVDSGASTVDTGHPLDTVHPLDDLVPGLALLRSWAGRSHCAPSIVELAARAQAAIRQVRPRVWLLAGAVVACSAVGLAAAGGSGGHGSGTPPLSATPEASLPALSAGPTPSRRSDSASPSASASASARASDTAEVLTGDDADEAVAVLLDLRAACLRALDAECLAGVDEPGSAALAADERGVADPSLVSVLPRPTLGTPLNRLGGVVLYRATGADGKPASVFVVKTEAGWRLRSIDSG